MPSAAALPNEPLPFPGCEVGYSPFLQQPAGQQPAQVPLSTNGYNTNIKQSFCQPQDQRPAIVTPPGYIPPKVDYATLPPPPEYSSSCSLTQLPMYQPQAASAPHYTYAPSASISNTTFVNVTNVSPAPYGVTAAHVIVTETKKSRRYRLNDEAQVSLFFLMRYVGVFTGGIAWLFLWIPFHQL